MCLVCAAAAAVKVHFLSHKAGSDAVPHCLPFALALGAGGVNDKLVVEALLGQYVCNVLQGHSGLVKALYQVQLDADRVRSWLRDCAPELKRR